VLRSRVPLGPRKAKAGIENLCAAECLCSLKQVQKKRNEERQPEGEGSLGEKLVTWRR
jgi:hypothetical protein